MRELSTLFPPLKYARRLPLSRDQIMLLLAAVNEFFLGVDTYLAHLISGTIRPREWIPIAFGPTAGLLLLIAGLIALKNRAVAIILANVVFLSSMVVGVMGAYFHFIRGTLPAAPAGQQVTLDLLVWAPPILAPFAFAGVGLLGLSAAWPERPLNSGRLQFFGQRFLQLPYSKTRAYIFMVSVGILAALISSVLDHARHGFENPWLWLPTLSGIFAVIVSTGLAATDKPLRTDLTIYVGAMVWLIIVGVVGVYFHVQADLTSENVIVFERFLRDAPFLAPLLFANMGLLGLVALIEPREEGQQVT